MPSPFSRTLRSLEADGNRRWVLALAPALLLLAAWVAWFAAAQVAVYEVSDSARLEADAAAHAVDAPVDGRIAALHWQIGERVAAGDVLVELEAAEQRDLWEEAQAQASALPAQVVALRRQVAAARRLLEDGRQTAAAALAEARARAAEAGSADRLAASDLARQETLHGAGLVPEAEMARFRSAAEQKRAAARALDLALDRLRWEARNADGERREKLADLERQLAQLAGQMASAGPSGRRLQRELELRTVRAPVAGRVGEIARLRVGAVVAQGDRLGSVVPEGALRVVAEFSPEAAIGRIRAGQRARLRLASFPALQFGVLAARVERVASEAGDGKIRVELSARPGRGSLLPFEHGLPGTVEIEVEHATPSALVLRTVGKLLGRSVGAGTAG
jgi:multidrug resistance efflux pump